MLIGSSHIFHWERCLDLWRRVWGENRNCPAERRHQDSADRQMTPGQLSPGVPPSVLHLDKGTGLQSVLSMYRIQGPLLHKDPSSVRTPPPYGLRAAFRPNVVDSSVSFSLQVGLTRGSNYLVSSSIVEGQSGESQGSDPFEP